jgi:adenine-specific DNA-methyltransferase
LADRESKYAGHSRDQLIALLEARDRQKKLGLVWERDEIEADQALDAEFIAAEVLPERSDYASQPNTGAGWPNLVIEGDNYDALRWLRMTLAGRVKCIYVDPPYNTGAKDWVYNDHYVGRDDRWRHSTWLEFLYRRFALARDLLTDDGVILVSINDENRAKLELLLDEVLPGMRVGSFVWRTKDSSNDSDRNFSSVHEHILIYSKPGFSFLGYQLDRSKYRHNDGDGRGDFSLDPITKAHSFKERENTYYPINDPRTGWWYPCNPDSVWRYASRRNLKAGQRLRTQTIEDLIEDDRIVFSATAFVQYGTLEELHAAIDSGSAPRDGKGRALLRRGLPDLEFWVGKPIGLGRPSKKSFWQEKAQAIRPASSYILGLHDRASDKLYDLVSGKQGDATGEVQAIFGSRLFEYPKPSSLIRSLLEAVAGPQDLVVDFFAGSATTAQAVMQLNAEDGGERRFIMVSSTEATVEEPDKNLCDSVTAERVRRLNASDSPVYAALEAPFAYLRMQRMKWEDVDYELTSSQAWAALETMHGLPLTVHDASAAWLEHSEEDATLILVERVDSSLIDRLREISARRAPAFIYAWAPGQISVAAQGLDVEVRPLREFLVSRFRT